MRRILALLPLLLLAPAQAPADTSFDAWWHDGKAELDGYRLVVQRYGHPRTGRGVMVYVTEPFIGSQRVKADDPSRHPGDTFDALKLNLVRSFQTGIYDYHTMASVFTRSADFSPVKETFGSAEWCGQVYEELLFENRKVSARYSSYFEGESAARTLDRPDAGLVEDDLFILLRGLRSEFLPLGKKLEVPLLESAFYRRLAHRGLEWTRGEVEHLMDSEIVHVPAGAFSTTIYRVRTSAGREGRFWVERAYPHRIIKWAWTDAPGAGKMGGTDAGELTGTTRCEYWKLHDPGDESKLDLVGLAPVVPQDSTTQ